MDGMEEIARTIDAASLGLIVPALAVLVVAYILSYRKMNAQIKAQESARMMSEEAGLEDSWAEEVVLDERSAGMIRRVQNALTPSEAHLMNFYDGAMVLYMPAEEVSGDFIFVEEVDDSIYLAVGDVGCSGAEGAVLTMACQSALSKVIHMSGHRDTSMLLHRLHQTVLETYADQADRLNFKISMGLCRYDIREKVLEFSGAGIGLWMFRKARILQSPTISRRRKGLGSNRLAGYTIREYSPAQVNLGLPGRIPGLSTRIVAVEQGDTIYLATDGFVNQPGGECGEQFGANTLKQMLCTIQREDMFDQRNILTKVFSDWKGSASQMDDATLVGLRF